MNTIAEITRNIIFSDQIHIEALKTGTLNLRAYASLIHKRVESLSKKEVKIPSIVIALSRIKESLPFCLPLKPEVKIESLSIKSDLSVITYEKTGETLERLSKSSQFKRRDKDFFVVSEGIAEITIVGDAKNINEIKRRMNTTYKTGFNESVAVTIRFDEKYVEIPNVLYSFVSSLALKRVNLLQVVSNLTEVSFIVEKKYMDDTVDVFQGFLSK